MKRFTEFVDSREKDLGPDLSDDTIYRVCKLAWRKHRKETEQFVRQLAAKDPEIGSVMNDIKGGDGPIPQDDMSKEKDEVVPPESDGSPGLDSADGGGGD